MAAITVVGGINIDIEGRPDQVLIPADSNPGRVSISAGGVGRNIVENIARLGGDVAMISLTGDDVMGQNAKAQLAALGADVSGVQKCKHHQPARPLFFPKPVLCFYRNDCRRYGRKTIPLACRNLRIQW